MMWIQTCAVAAVLAGSADNAPDNAPAWRPGSAELLPLESLQGRSMDAELTDLNADGMPDLIVASEFGQNVVLLASRAGSFAESTNALPRGRIHDSEDIAVADFDADDRPDIVFVAEDDQTNELYLQTQPGVFIDASDRLPAPGGVSNAVLAVDIDADGDLDLILGNAGDNVVLLNDGAAGFTPDQDGRIPADARTTQDIEPADIDADGDTDLIIANEDGNRILINDGRGFFDDETDERLPSMPDIETREIDAADLDADGDLDLVFANVGWRPGKDPTNRVLLNDGTGVFTEAESLPPSGGNTLDTELADLDGDGDTDILFGHSQSGPPVQVWINGGNAAFKDRTASWVPQLTLVHTIDLEPIDLDADGKLDLYIANHVSADVLLVNKPVKNAG